MTNNKQTALEWFFEQLTEVDYNCINKTFLKNDNSLAGYRLRELLKQAKEMDKEQHRVTAQDFYYGSHSFKNFEQYYNETYGGGEQ
jgi:predicted S18 family serine protease